MPERKATAQAASSAVLELEIQEKNLIYHLHNMFLENNCEGFEQTNCALRRVRDGIYRELMKTDITSASDNK